MNTDAIKLDRIDEIIRAHGTEQHCLIPLLQAVQAEYNYLPEKAMRRICELTSITPSSIMSVSTFYSRFRHKPAGRHFVRVCVGTACYVKGADTVFESFRRNLNIEGDEDTDVQRVFTVEKVPCLGCCMLAPAVDRKSVV